MKYLIITKTKWCKSNFTSLDKSFKIADKYNFKVINKLKPKIIFFFTLVKKNT